VQSSSRATQKVDFSGSKIDLLGQRFRTKAVTRRSRVSDNRAIPRVCSIGPKFAAKRFSNLVLELYILKPLESRIFRTGGELGQLGPNPTNDRKHLHQLNPTIRAHPTIKKPFLNSHAIPFPLFSYILDIHGEYLSRGLSTEQNRDGSFISTATSDRSC
jgi:hypothetical protein